MAKDKERLGNPDLPLGDQPGDAATESQALHGRIAEKAYELYQRRGQAHGFDLDDWIEAEQMVLRELQDQPVVRSRKTRTHRSQKAHR